MDKQEFFLRLCPYMKGIKEAWIIDRRIFVSPAIFQLLTDQDDPETISLVANQLTFKAVSHRELAELTNSRDFVSSMTKTTEVVIHFVRM